MSATTRYVGHLTAPDVPPAPPTGTEHAEHLMAADVAHRAAFEAARDAQRARDDAQVTYDALAPQFTAAREALDSTAMAVEHANAAVDYAAAARSATYRAAVAAGFAVHYPTDDAHHAPAIVIPGDDL